MECRFFGIFLGGSKVMGSHPVVMDEHEIKLKQRWLGDPEWKPPSDLGQKKHLTLWLFNIAMENGPFIDGLPIKNGDFPWLC